MQRADGHGRLVARLEDEPLVAELPTQAALEHEEALRGAQVVVGVTSPPEATSSSASVRSPPVSSLVSSQVTTSFWTGFTMRRAGAPMVSVMAWTLAALPGVGQRGNPLSEKTIENVLTRIYEKLGVRSRVELARKLPHA